MSTKENTKADAKVATEKKIAARITSDEAEKVAQEAQAAENAAKKIESDPEAATETPEVKSDAVKENKPAPAPVANKKDQEAKKQAKLELELMDQYKTDILFKNRKGEYFTNENFAYLSENNIKANVTKIVK